MSQKFCNICICASFQNKLEEPEGIKLIPHITYSMGLAPSDYYLFVRLQELRGGGSFRGVLCLEGIELVSVWDQKTGKKVLQVV